MTRPRRPARPRPMPTFAYGTRGRARVRSAERCVVALLAAAAWAVLPAGAAEDHRDTAEENAAELARRARDHLDRQVELERKVERLEGKIDRLEALIRSIYGERLRRIEALARDEEFASAARRLEERYGLAKIADSPVSGEAEALLKLQRSLARTAADSGVADFARDPDVARLIAAIAGRREYTADHLPGLVASITGANAGAGAALVAGLLDVGTPAAVQAALWGAFRAEGEGLAERLSALAAEAWAERSGGAGEGDNDGPQRPQSTPRPERSVPSVPSVADRRSVALAQAAAAAHGDALGAERLARLVRSGGLRGRFASQLALRLRSAGAKAAFRIYVELILDPTQGFAAAQAVTRIVGCKRRIGPQEFRDPDGQGREKLHEELKLWLDRHWEKLRYDKRSRRFTVLEEGEEPQAPAGPARPARRPPGVPGTRIPFPPGR